MSKIWDDTEIFILQKMFNAGASDVEIAAALTEKGDVRTAVAVNSIRRKLGLRRRLVPPQAPAGDAFMGTTLKEAHQQNIEANGRFVAAMAAQGFQPGDSPFGARRKRKVAFTLPHRASAPIYSLGSGWQ